MSDHENVNENVDIHRQSASTHTVPVVSEKSFMELFENNSNIPHSQPWVSPPADTVYLGFHRSRDGYSIGTNNMFRTITMMPYYKDLKPTGKSLYSIVKAVHDRSETVALIGAGRNPQHPSNHVYLWDVNLKAASEIFCEAAVLNVELRIGR